MITIDIFDDFLNRLYDSIRWYYRYRIFEICLLLNHCQVNLLQLYSKVLFDETTKSYYSLYDLIVEGLCPSDILIRDRIDEIRKRNIGL